MSSFDIELNVYLKYEKKVGNQFTFFDKSAIYKVEGFYLTM